MFQPVLKDKSRVAGDSLIRPEWANMIAILFKRFCFLMLHCYHLLWSIHRIYYALLEMFKVYDSTAVGSSVDEDKMDYSSESSGREADW